MDIHSILPASLKRNKKQVIDHVSSILFSVIFLLAIFIRLPQLNGSFWLDEAAQALESARPLSEQFDIVGDFQPPLLHLIVHVAQRFSHSEWWLRLWGALLPGLGTIVFTYLIGKQFYKPQIGLIASLLLATNSFHVFFSQELRPYSLPTFLAVCSWWLLFWWLKKIRKATGLAWIVTNIAGLYSSYLFPFTLVAQVLYVWWWHRKATREFLLNSTVVGFSFVPWLPIFLQQLQAGQLVKTQLPGWEDVVGFGQLKVMPITFGKFIFGIVDLQISPLFAAVSLVLLSFSFIAIREKTLSTSSLKNSIMNAIFDRQKPHTVAGLLCWFIISLGAAWVISFFIPILQPKRVLFLLPAFYLLLSIVTDWFRHRATRYAFIVCLLIINCVGLIGYWTDPRLQREDWRNLHLKIEERFSQEETILLFAHPEPFAPWRWYDSGRYQTQSLGAEKLHVDQLPSVSDHFKQATSFKYILVFDYLRDLSDPEDQILTTLKDFGYQEIGALDQTNIGFVRIYVDSTSLTAYNEDF